MLLRKIHATSYFQVDKLIDLAAPPPKGTGVQNIRECIIQDKMTFDVSADEWQAYLKEKIMNNIERYFYLIVFAMYVREVGPQDYNKTFKQWMDDNGHLRDMIAEGRSKLEWERKIPDEKLVDLKDMLNSDDFKTHLPKVNLLCTMIQELGMGLGLAQPKAQSISAGLGRPKSALGRKNLAQTHP